MNTCMTGFQLFSRFFALFYCKQPVVLGLRPSRTGRVSCTQHPGLAISISLPIAATDIQASRPIPFNGGGFLCVWCCVLYKRAL